MYAFQKPKSKKASDESAEMNSVFHYSWIDQPNSRVPNSTRNSGIFPAASGDPSYTLIKKPKIYGAQDSRQLRQLLDHENDVPPPHVPRKMARKHEVIPSFGPMDLLMKADLKREVCTPDRNKQKGLRDSQGVAELISNSYRGQSPKHFGEKRLFGKQVMNNRSHAISSSLNVSQALCQDDLYSHQTGYTNRRGNDQ